RGKRVRDELMNSSMSEESRMSNSITRQPFWTLALLAVMLLPAVAVGCSGQKTEEPTQVADQAPPPPAEQEPERSAPPPQREKARAEHRIPAHRATGAVPEDRPRRISPEPPQEPATVTLTIPKGTALEVRFTQPLTSETAQVGEAVTTELKNSVIVGE